MADVILENLTKQYDSGTLAVDDLTLHVRDGELLVLIGPSGCGKSTTLRLIAGLESPTDGVVRIAGRNVNRQRPHERDVAMVFQDHSLYPHMTVQQNMAFGLKMRGIRRADRDEKVRAAAEALGIAHLLHRKPGQLSGGERQRAALGRALVRRPQCFLLDEPLSNLDPATRFELREQIRILHRQINATMIFVTHDQSEAMSLGERIAVMRHGAIQQIGTPMEIYFSPANRFVASFFGSPRINFVEGHIAREGLGLLFCSGQDIRIPVPAEKAVLLQYHVGKPVLAGIRPGHLREPASADDSHVPLWLRITHVEPLGGRTLVHTQTVAGVSMTADIEGSDDYQPERHATFCVDPQMVHYFEADEAGKCLVQADVKQHAKLSSNNV